MNSNEMKRHRTQRAKELCAGVDAAEALLAVAMEREYAQECALHYAHQAARHASADQQAQADAWCAAAADRLHQTILAVERTRAGVQELQAELAAVRGMLPAA